MPTAKCCGCNGPVAVCRNCRCAKNNSPCVSCYPARRNMCQNQAPGSTPVPNDHDRVLQSTEPQTSTNKTTPSNNITQSQSLLEDITSFQRGSILDRVPKAARHAAASALNSIIKSVCDANSEDSWRKLFRFSS